MKNTKLILFSLLIFGFVWGCGNKSGNYDFIPAAFKIRLPLIIKINSAEEIANASADDYNQNNFGLITYSKLNSWVQDWPNRKPLGIYGKLFIFQVQTGTPSGQYVFPKTGSGVYVHLLTDADTTFGQTRNNGVIDTETMVPQGSQIDGFLKKYGIDLQNDLVVFSADTPTTANLQQALRGWYALRYWGAPAKSLAILNGAVSYHASQGNLFTTLFLSPLNSAGGKGVQSLLTDNTILQATLGDVIHILKNGNSNFLKVTPVPVKGVFFLDARSVAEYTGTASSTTGPSGKTCATPPCVTGIEGHIKGAVNIPFANLLEDTNITVQFKTKAQIQNLFSAAGFVSGQTIITYCRTNVRSTVTGFASVAILGIPTRYYDGSWVEWGSLATDNRAISDDMKWSNLPAVSPWKTNLSILTDNLTANPDTNVAKTSFTTAQAFSRSSNQLIDEDKSYLSNTSGSSGSGSGGSSGGGGGGGGNACGG
ncbi:sulfurtransferase [Leptospira stimsonii]|uniref:Sulfurtransferase n=1 Tax=Leptospira stimsonii TaxID=2202203 RepID=A0A8B3CM18_9LEPT|nr:sulfurtransferase [Leptospira stimsonii]RHX84550.1 sulfurtransferase [Leptospira stimsonii]